MIKLFFLTDLGSDYFLPAAASTASSALSTCRAALAKSSYTLATLPSLPMTYVTRPGNAPNSARGTFQELRTTSPASMSSSYEVTLFDEMNFSLSAGPPLETPKTSALAALKSGKRFWKAQTYIKLLQERMLNPQDSLRHEQI